MHKFGIKVLSLVHCALQQLDKEYSTTYGQIISKEKDMLFDLSTEMNQIMTWDTPYSMPNMTYHGTMSL